MVDIARLKHHERGGAWIDVRAIEREALRRPGERHVGLDVVKSAGGVAEVLTLEEDDGEIGRHAGDYARSSRACECPHQLS